MSSLLQPISQAATDAATGVTSASGAAASSFSAVLPVGDLSNLAATASQVATGPLSVAPHFGTAASLQAVQSLSQSLSLQLPELSVLQFVDPEILASLELVAKRLQAVASLIPVQEVTGAFQGLSGLPTPTLTSLNLTSMGAVMDSWAAAAASSWDTAVTDGVGGYQLSTLAMVASGVLVGVAASVPKEGYEGPCPSEGPELSHEYDPAILDQYFAQRPIMVAQRAAQVAKEASVWGSALLMDIWTDKVKVNEPARAAQLRSAIEGLGPAYVKVAQALSTRVDLLTPEYFNQIQLLQDRVQPFPCEVARQAMAASFGRPVDMVFDQLSDKPVAAASLGQVYRGSLKASLGGADVAVKVLRPGVLEQVALDLYLMRRLFSELQKMPKVTTDWVAIIDSWAVRFFHEMDYEREARNAMAFKEQMMELEGITVAPIFTNLSTDSVLVTQWVEGEKLSESRAADVRELCNTLLNCYLIQLLDTGFLHADPHPGNLIRTPDGKMCILDFGLMTEVTEDQRLALVEYIAHLCTEDWANVALDLQRLGFIPADVDTQRAGLVEPLGRILKQLTGGGGAAKVNIDKVTYDLEELGKQYPFQVPSFFALILRSFSVIEGIALQVDPNYAIVQECFPYLSRRLLTDDSPRIRKALHDVLYGNKKHLDIDRLVRIVDGFAAFTTDGLKDGQGAAAATTAAAATYTGIGSSRPTPVVNASLREALLTVFNPRGSYLQELMVGELVAAVDALSREALTSAAMAVLRSGPAALSSSAVQALGPLRPLLLPLPTPVELISNLAPAVALTQEDEEALGVVRGIFSLMQRLPPAAMAPQVTDARSAGQAAAELRGLVWELLPGLASSGDLFVRTFFKRLALRTAEVLVPPRGGFPSAEPAFGMMPLNMWGPDRGRGKDESSASNTNVLPRCSR